MNEAIQTKPKPVRAGVLSRYRSILLCGISLLFGVAVGIGVTALFVGGAAKKILTMSAEQLADKTTAGIIRHVTLNQEQTEKIRKAVQIRVAALYETKAEVHRKISREIDGLCNDISDILDAEQNEKWMRSPKYAFFKRMSMRRDGNNRQNEKELGSHEKDF